MDQWFEDLNAHLNPTALTREIYDDLDEYISKTFPTEQDYRDELKAVVNFTILLKDSAENATSIDVDEAYKKKYGTSFLESAKKFKNLYDKYILADSPWCYDDINEYGQMIDDEE